MLSPKAWRLELGYDRERLSALVGVHPQSWFNYEHGHRIPPLDVIVRCQELSGGRVTAESWLAVTLARPEARRGRLYGVQIPAHLAPAVAA